MSSMENNNNNNKAEEAPMEVINLMPDYEAMFKKFLDDSRHAEAGVLSIGKEDYQSRYYDRELYLESRRKEFEMIHRWLGPFVIALQTLTREKELTQLREVAAAFLERVSEEARHRESEMYEEEE